MSFSTSHSNVMSTDDIKVETMGTTPTERHLMQFNAGKAAAAGLMSNGVIGSGPFNVTIGGHAMNDSGEAAEGDSVYVSIMKSYAVITTGTGAGQIAADRDQGETSSEDDQA